MAERGFPLRLEGLAIIDEIRNVIEHHYLESITQAMNIPFLRNTKNNRFWSTTDKGEVQNLNNFKQDDENSSRYRSDDLQNLSSKVGGK